MSKPRQLVGIGLLAWVCGCGSNGGGTSGSTSVGGGSTDTVSATDISGVGRVLIDSGGMALYTPEQEANGTVLCVATCTSIWIPLAPGPGAPTAAPGTTTVGVIDRPDGAKQVTGDGHPLYTFVSDSPGMVTGNGVMDEFGGQHFTWHVVLADGTGGGGGGGGGGGTGGGGY